MPIGGLRDFFQIVPGVGKVLELNGGCDQCVKGIGKFFTGGYVALVDKKWCLRGRLVGRYEIEKGGGGGAKAIPQFTVDKVFDFKASIPIA